MDQESGKPRSRLIGGEAPTVHVAAFGKHPGWNDHIDDLGIETPELGEIKRVLYSQGIGGVIDAGTWDALAEDQRLAGFDHWFFWRRGAVLTLGRMWSSVDGKGRTKYPMIVCASARGVDATWMIEHAGPAMADLASACREVEGSAAVIERVSQARARLRSELPTEGHAVIHDRTAAATLADCEELGPERVGLYRILYQIEREMSAFRPLAGSATKSTTVRPAQLRVPRCQDKPIWGARLWLRFMREQLAPPSAILVIAPEGADWVDIIVGEPGPAQLACIRSDPHAVPLTSDVPYTLDESFISRADATIARTQDQIDEAVGPTGIGALRGAVGSITERLRDSTARTSAKNRKPILIVVGAVAGAIVLVLLAMFMFGGRGGEKERAGGRESGGEPKPKNGAPATDVASSWTPEDRTRWEAWCRAYEGWVAPLARDLASEQMRRDEHLSASIAPILARARDLDPRSLVQSGTRRLSLLISSPPPEVQTSESIKATREAVQDIGRLESALSFEQWPARARAARVAESLASLGFSSASNSTRILAESVDIGQPAALVGAITGILDASDGLARAAEAIQSFESGVAALNDSADPFPASFTGLARASFSRDADGDLARATARIREAAAVADEIASFMEDGWDRVDQELWKRESRTLATDLSGADLSTASRWLAEIRQPRFRVPDESDPRIGLELASGLNAATERVEQLRQGATASETEALDQIGARIDEARSRWLAIAEVRWERPSVDRVRSEIEAVQGALREANAEIARADLRVAKDLEAYGAMLRSRSGVAPSGSQALDGVWRQRRDELIASFGAPETFVTLRERIESLEDFINDADQAFATGVDVSAAPQSIDRRSLSPLIAEAREQAIRRAVEHAKWSESGEFATDAQWRDVLSREVSSHRAWCDTLSSEIARAARVERAVDSWRPLDELIDDAGVSAAAWLHQVQSLDATSAVHVACAPMISRLERLESIGTSADPEALFAAGARSQNGAAAMLAWRRLTSLDGWIQDGGDLDRLVGLRDRIQSALAAANNEARFRGIDAELAGTGRNAWSRAAERAASFPALADVCSRADRFGGSVDSLSPRARFNVAISDLQRTSSLDALAGLEESDLRERARAATARLNAIGAHDPSAAAFVESLRALAESGEGDGPSVDLSSIGPASKGWTVEEVGDGSVLRFAAPGSSDVLEFERLEPESGASTGATSFLLRTELSLGVVSRLLAELGDWDKREEQWAELRDARQGRASDRGARAWKWDGRSATIVPASGWIEPPAGVPAYPDGLDVQPPSEESPIQAISPAASAFIAEALGCDLPTVAQWSTAVESAPRTSRPNLRDATWARQRDHAAQFNAAFKALPAPDAGTFLPTSIRAALGADAVVATTDDDGVLWFAPVSQSSSGFENLIGNVAEWVRTDEGGFAVIGGSALSAPQLDPSTAYPIPGHRERSAYADVGLRLAFVVEGFDPRSALRYRLFRACRDAPFLPAND
ncbi:MAG: hypothetical protein H6811_06350 [Phycisphaeraceae bacterium]|nr:hypothetical protein [Phycisphaeraceae bacterium]